MTRSAKSQDLFATVARSKLTGEVTTASFVEKDLDAVLDSIRLLLKGWNPGEDDTAVIRIMTES